MMKPWAKMFNERTFRGVKYFSTIIKNSGVSSSNLLALTENRIFPSSRLVTESLHRASGGSACSPQSQVLACRRISTTVTGQISHGKIPEDMVGHGTNPILYVTRGYAKGRDKLSNKKKSAVKINEDEMAELIDVAAYKAGLEELHENLREEFQKQLNVRGAAGALETLEVEFEGELHPLQELAQVGRKNPQLVVLNLASLPDALQPVLKAIESSGMNLNPQQEGTTIYLPIPKVTREHRENMARNAKTLVTKYKGLFQTLQNRYIKQCRSNKEGMSEDLVFEVQQQIMKLASTYVQQAEELCKTKQKELLQQE